MRQVRQSQSLSLCLFIKADPVKCTDNNWKLADKLQRHATLCQHLSEGRPGVFGTSLEGCRRWEDADGHVKWHQQHCGHQSKTEGGNCEFKAYSSHKKPSLWTFFNITYCRFWSMVPISCPLFYSSPVTLAAVGESRGKVCQGLQSDIRIWLESKHAPQQTDE